MNNYESLVNEKYYVVLELPFEILLVYKYGFARLHEAEEVRSDLPWFSIWDEDKLNAWKGKTIYIPVKDLKDKKDQYTMKVTLQLPVKALTPTAAHKAVRKGIQKTFPKARGVRTTVTAAKINLRKGQNK